MDRVNEVVAPPTHLPEDQRLLDAVSDVAWRFYAYDQYGRNPARATKALAKRAPGYSPGFYKELFDLHLELLKETAAAVGDAPLFRKPGEKHAQYTEESFAFVLDRLRSRFPGYPDDFLRSDIGMVMYWFYRR